MAGPILELPFDTWNPNLSETEQDRVAAALEGGQVLVLPGLACAVAPEELALLSPSLLDDSRKNISYDPLAGTCRGTDLTGEPLARLTAMLRRYGDGAESLVHALLPAYAGTLRRARASFRPAEIAGRSYSPRHDDRRLHVDAFPTRPTGGDRILRVFTNASPDGVLRQWRVGEPFADHAARFLARLKPMAPGQAAVMATLGLTKGRRRTQYDHLMLGLHDASKQDARYQDEAPRTDIAFAPGTTWMCFTDQVPHAALAGRFAFEQTFHLPVASLAAPETAPLRVLERMTGKALA